MQPNKPKQPIKPNLSPKYINHLNLILHTLGNDYTNLYQYNFMKLLQVEINLLQKLRLKDDDIKYNNLVVRCLNLAEYKNIPTILNNLLSDLFREEGVDIQC